MIIERIVWLVIGVVIELDEALHVALRWLVGHADELRRRLS